MTDIWTAVVGAGSALVGVGLTGGFTLLKGRQDGAEKDRDREEQRRIMHRASRRDAYIAVLSQYHVADSAIDFIWKMTPTSNIGEPMRQEFSDAETAVKNLREATATVSIEGPMEVAQAGHNLWVSCWDVLNSITEISVENAGASQPIFMLASADQAQNEARRHVCRGAFISAARGAIGGDAPAFS